MKPHRSMLSRIWSKCFPNGEGTKARASEPVRPSRMDGSLQGNGKSPRSPHGGIEMLEGRIAPAILLNPTTLIYTDVDGDQVTVKFSKALFNQSGEALQTVLNNVFKFNTGTIAVAGTPAAESPDALAPQQLQKIDLTALPLLGSVGNQYSPAAGVSITVTAKRADTLMPKPDGAVGEVVPGQDHILDGDDLANVGAIVASSSSNSFNLGKVTIDGDLGQIDAGSSKFAVGLASLKVHSLGVATNTQMAGGNLESTIVGSLGSLTVTTDVKGAYLNVVNGSGSGNKAIGKIGNVTIGGTLEGLAGNNTGLIQSATSIGKIKIGSGEIVVPPAPTVGEEVTTETITAVTDGIKGGAGKNSGAIIAATTITNITINGDIQGGTGESSGSIKGGNIGAIVVGTGLEGHGILGNSGLSSGSISAGGKITSILLKGDLLGGVGDGSSTSSASNSGAITANGSIGKVQVTGSIGTLPETDTLLAGGASGRIYAKGSLGSVTVNGDLHGGSARDSGTIQSDGTMGVVTIKGNLLGGGAGAGGIVAGDKLAGVVINGNLEGGTGLFSGFVQGYGQIGFVKIGGDLKGTTSTAAERAGVIVASGSIGEVNIAGSVIGGKGDYSGFIQAAGDGIGSLGKVTIGKQLLGGEGHSSGAINSGTKITSVVINNSLKAETAVQGGVGTFSGSISAGTTISSVTIKGDVNGGNGDYSASIQASGLLAKLTIAGDLQGGKGDWSGSIFSMDDWSSDTAGNLGKLTISGVLKAGEGDFSGRISADGNLTSLTVGGIDVGTFESGSPGAGSASVVAGAGFYSPGNVGSISVTGSMNGGGNHHTLLEIYGSLGSLSVRGGIADGDIHVGGNLGKLTVGVAGKRGVVADIENVVLTAGGLPPASAKLATAIASITVTGDVSHSQILAGYDVLGEATNANARIGTVKVSGDWVASDLVAGIKAVNGYFGDGNDEVIEDAELNLTSRIANVLITGSVVGTDVDSDHFGFVAQEIGKFKVGKTVITPNVQTGLPDDVSVRTVSAFL